MKPSGPAWNRRLVDNAERTVVRHRNAPMVLTLTILTVCLLIGGLFADISLRAVWLMVACYMAAAVSGAVLFAFLFSRKLRIERRPRR